jgi:hypothetical protein
MWTVLTKNRCNQRNLWIVFSELRGILQLTLKLNSTVRLMRTTFCFASLALLLGAFGSDCLAQKVVDRMVATVNAGARTDLITYSDLVWQVALQPGSQLDNPTSEELNRALHLLIDQRLILQEAEKLPTISPSAKEINDAKSELARNFPSQAEFQLRLMKVGLTSEKLDEIVEQRLKMEKYLDFRFRNFVVVSQKEIADYYRDTYVPRFRTRFPGRIVPTVDESRVEIEQSLTEAKIESETDSFLDTARERAEIVMLSTV